MEKKRRRIEKNRHEKKWIGLEMTGLERKWRRPDRRRIEKNRKGEEWIRCEKEMSSTERTEMKRKGREHKCSD
jgi:hypothetical protein